MNKKKRNSLLTKKEYEELIYIKKRPLEMEKRLKEAKKEYEEKIKDNNIEVIIFKD